MENQPASIALFQLKLSIQQVEQPLVGKRELISPPNQQMRDLGGEREPNGAIVLLQERDELK
ncbi:hypothetical protein PGRAT_09630 [Paenibacillus graminis]|uniref:Uncharacterized protein n=1 Tax=Paenibacillus graminis TaxID=189425 RepID=A0A089NFT5_9BACL|nr:hypothetical protein PGRAT_09630 [Paenibacillus graminis]